MFKGADANGFHTYEITFNQSLADTRRMNGIEIGLNDRVLQETKKPGDIIHQTTHTTFGIRGRIVAAITILFGGSLSVRSTIETYHEHCHTGKSESKSTIVAPEWFNRMFKRKHLGGLHSPDEYRIEEKTKV